MKITTAREMRKFLGFAEAYIARNPRERTPLTFALQNHYLNKMKKWMAEFEEDLSLKRADLEAEFCLMENGSFKEKEIIVGNQVVFKKLFDKEGERKRKAAYDKYEDDKLNEKVEYNSYIVPVPVGLDISWVDVFTPILFDEMSDEDKEKWYLAQAEKEKPKEIN